MSRRKVRGLTRTGRQVSEDPDLDNLLLNLSPEEMEELQKEVSTVPDPDPSEIIMVDQTDLKQTIPNKRDSILTNHGELKTGLQRNFSIEGEPRRESRKQEYLRKMGLSQETNVSSNDSKEEGCQIFMCSPPVTQVNNMDNRNTRVIEDSKDARARQFKRNEESEKKCEVKKKEQNDDYKHKDKRDTKEASSKTKKGFVSFHILFPVALICNLVMDPLLNERIKAMPNGQTGVWGLQWKRQNGPSKGSASKGFGPIPVPSLSNDLAYDSLNFIITVLYADCIKNRHFQNLFAGLQ